MISAQTNSAMMPPRQRPRLAPRLSHAPWAGFGAHDHKRDEALVSCPSRRCARVKACVAAHEGIYCQRTHLSHAQFLAARPPALPPPFADNLDLRRERMLDAIATRKAFHDMMTARWKAGEFDDLYGPWAARGVLMQPPLRVF